MSNFLFGIACGATGMVIFFIVLKAVTFRHSGIVFFFGPALDLIEHSLPKDFWNQTTKIRDHFDWNKSELFVEIVNYGLASLLLYQSEEGGIWARQEDGRAGLIPFPIDDVNFNDRIAPFDDYLSSLD